MASWATILNCEQMAVQQLLAAQQGSTVNIFDKYRPNPGGQTRFWNTTSLEEIDHEAWRWLCLCGGIGSGKSYTGAVWAVTRALLQPEARGLIGANTFGQLSRASLMTLVEVCRDFNVPLSPYRDSIEDNALAIANSQRCYIGEQRAFVYVLSMNSFSGKTQSSRGLQIRWSWLDEAAFSVEQSFLTLDGRLGRGPGDMKGQGLLTTSPNGFNWLYDRFGDPNRDESREKLYVLFNCPTRENVKYLGEDYVEGLLTNYTDELAAQELEGAFINTVVGRCYKYFDRTIHALQGEDAEILAYDKYADIHIGFDFNYSPAVCVLGQRRGNEIHFFKEFYVIDSDTFELAGTVADWLQENEFQAELQVYGDASGRARSAASRLTNWDIVFETLKKRGFKTHRRFKDANPPVMSRVNSANCLMKTQRVFMSFEGCPELIKDLEMVIWNDHGMDKSDPMRTHMSDAWSYILHYLFPYREAAVRMGAKQTPLKGIAA
jgi:hypothetical protein